MVIAKKDHPDAGSIVVFDTGKPIRAIEGRQDFYTNSLNLERRFLRIIAQILQQNDKFITAQARDSVDFSYTIRQPLRDLLQQQIAFIMTKSIVKCLEIIQIKKQYGTMMSIAMTFG